MPAVSRVTDNCSGDGTWLPTLCADSSQDLLFVDSLSALVKGTAWPQQINSVPPPPVDHFGRESSAGSSLVYVEGVELCRVGDAISNYSNCVGSVIAGGSSVVFAD